jgi:hypothetical protein
MSLWRCIRVGRPDHKRRNGTRLDVRPVVWDMLVGHAHASDCTQVGSGMAAS